MESFSLLLFAFALQGHPPVDIGFATDKFSPNLTIIADTVIRGESFTIPVGTIVTFVGKVTGNTKRMFLITADDVAVARGEFERDWRLEWPTAQVEPGSKKVEIWWLQGRLPRQFLTSINLSLFKGSPFDVAHSVKNETAEVEITFAPKQPSTRIFVSLAVGRWRSPDLIISDTPLSAIIPASALQPGVHTIEIESNIERRIPLETIRLPISIPNLIRMDPLGHEINIDRVTVQENLEGSYSLENGFVLKEAFVKLNGTAIRVPTSGTYRIAKNLLRAGLNEIVVAGRTEKGAYYESDPLSALVRFDPRWLQEQAEQHWHKYFGAFISSVPRFLNEMFGIRQLSSKEDVVVFVDNRIQKIGRKQEGSSISIVEDGWKAAPPIVSSLKAVRPSESIDAAPEAFQRTIRSLDGEIENMLRAVLQMGTVLEQFNWPEILLGPNAGSSWCRAKREDLLETRKTLKATASKLLQFGSLSNEFDWLIERKYEVKGFDMQSLVHSWDSKNLPRVAIYFWIEGVQSVLESIGIGSARVLSRADLLNVVEQTTIRDLEFAASRFSRVLPIIDWERFGLDRNRSLGSQDAETLRQASQEFAGCVSHMAEWKRLEVRLRGASVGEPISILNRMEIELSLAWACLSNARGKYQPIIRSHMRTMAELPF